MNAFALVHDPRPCQFGMLLWLTMAVAWLAGCDSGEAPLKIGTYPWLGFSTLYHAKALGLFNDKEVTLVDLGNTREVAKAFSEGSVDAAALTLDEALRLAYMRTPGTVVMVFGHSKGGDALVARPGITTIGELRGRRVGVETSSEGDYLLERMLGEGGMHRSDVRIVDIDFDRQEQAYLAGEVDALVTMDPVRSRLLGLGARVLYSSRNIEGELLDVLLVNKEALERQPENVTRAVAAHFRSLDLMMDDPMAAAMRLRAKYGDPGNILSGWTQIEFAGRGANLRLLGNGDFRNLAQRVERNMVRYGLIASEAVEPVKVNDRYVRSSP